MFIYQGGKNSGGKLKNIPLEIMNKPFITSLLGLELPEKNRVKKLVGFILVYLVKRINIRIWGKRMLEFILNELENVDSKRTIFSHIFCLREISSHINIQFTTFQRNNVVKKLQHIWLKHHD